MLPTKLGYIIDTKGDRRSYDLEASRKSDLQDEGSETDNTSKAGAGEGGNLASASGGDAGRGDGRGVAASTGGRGGHVGVDGVGVASGAAVGR